ncbi:MAG: radical SAM protein [Candidatus Thermoplasmatota archaeon]|nr:radical SAM protein [Candidatus Thermoplasmatota archaeon]
MFRSLYSFGVEKVKCRVCGKEGIETSKTLAVCSNCIKSRWQEAEPLVKEAHSNIRGKFSMPIEPPKSEGGIDCGLCLNNCKLKSNEVGYCGIRVNRNGRIESLVGNNNAVLEWYYDALPTNCVAMEFCENRKLSYQYKNLAVFYGACSFNCLFCQNWHYRHLVKEPKLVMSANELASKVDGSTKCVCYFGGDPTPQILHAIETSKIILGTRNDVRICFETNGSMSRSIVKKAAELAFQSKGTIKFDLKAHTEELNIALCSVSNKNTLGNFEWLAENFSSDYNFLVASTLLVPGYVDEKEVENIAKFISALSKKIPYNLLAFHPQFYMTDMPVTSKELAFKCYKIATKYLENVRIGNVHLLV